MQAVLGVGEVVLQPQEQDRGGERAPHRADHPQQREVVADEQPRDRGPEHHGEGPGARPESGVAAAQVLGREVVDEGGVGRGEQRLADTEPNND